MHDVSEVMQMQMLMIQSWMV
jgi:hypothetical protein